MASNKDKTLTVDDMNALVRSIANKEIKVGGIKQKTNMALKLSRVLGKKAFSQLNEDDKARVLHILGMTEIVTVTYAK